MSPDITALKSKVFEKKPLFPNPLGCPGTEVRINGLDQWVISPTYQWGIPWGYNPLILTIDPNFLPDIQALQLEGRSIGRTPLKN